MALERIDHVGINVRDLSTSLAFYRKAFDFDVVHKWTTTWMIGKDQIRLGLFQRPDAKPVCNVEQTLGIAHFALRTDAAGFEAIQKSLQAAGIAFDAPEDTGIAYSIFVFDPDGNEIEVTTYDRGEQGKSP
jgi:catechol 2,3-dioxygenase-like lactoylglutathione lyase family enzyme